MTCRECESVVDAYGLVVEEYVAALLLSGTPLATLGLRTTSLKIQELEQDSL